MSKYDFIAGIVRRIPARRPIASADPFGFIDNGTWRTVPNHLSGSGPATHFDLLYEYATPAERKRLNALIQEQFNTGIDPTDTLRELGIHRFSASYTPQTGQVYFNIGVRDGEKLTPENKAAIMAEARLHPDIAMATDTGDRFNARPGNLEWFNKNFLLPISSALALNKAAKDRGFAQNAAIDAATVFPFLIPQVAAAVLGGMAAIPTGKPDLFQKRGGSILSNMASDEALKGIRVMEGVRDAYEAIMAAPPQTRKAMLDHLTRIAPKTWVNQVKQMFHDAPVSTSLAAIPILPGKTPVSLGKPVGGRRLFHGTRSRELMENPSAIKQAEGAKGWGSYLTTEPAEAGIYAQAGAIEYRLNPQANVVDHADIVDHVKMLKRLKELLSASQFSYVEDVIKARVKAYGGVSYGHLDDIINGAFNYKDSTMPKRVLTRAGIDGIRYPTKSTGVSGELHYNYVITNPKALLPPGAMIRERIASPTQYWMRKALEMTPEEFTTFASRSSDVNIGTFATRPAEVLIDNPAVKEHYRDVMRRPESDELTPVNSLTSPTSYAFSFQNTAPDWKASPHRRIDLGTGERQDHISTAREFYKNNADAPIVTAPAAVTNESVQLSPVQALSRVPASKKETFLHELTHLQQAERGHRITSGPVDDALRDELHNLPSENMAHVNYRLLPSEWKADEAAMNVGHYEVFPQQALQMTPLEFYNWVQQQRPNIGFSNKPTPTVVAQRKQRRQELRGAGIIK